MKSLVTLFVCFVAVLMAGLVTLILAWFVMPPDNTPPLDAARHAISGTLPA